MDTVRKAGNAPGFTLVELMAVTLIVAVVLGLGLPALGKITAQTRIATAAQRMQASLNLARMEAIKGQVPVQVCPRAGRQSAPVCGGGMDGGWITWIDRDDNGDLDPGESVIQVVEGLPAGYQVTNRAGTRVAGDRITYLPDGSSHRNRTLLFCPPPGVDVTPRAVVINLVGRPRLATDWGDCPPGLLPR